MEESDIKEEDKVSYHLFGWCSTGHHKQCKRIYRRSYTEPRKNKLIWLDEVHRCACKKRGCPCYTKPADRPKKAVKKTRRKN